MTVAEPRSYPFSPYEGWNLAPAYAELREAEPVCPVRSRHGDAAWLVTRYEDVRAVLADPRFSRAAAAENENEPHMRPYRGGTSKEFLLGLDAPQHTRLRRLAVKAFTNRRVQRHRPRIEQIARELVDKMLAKGPPADLVKDFASPLPIAVLCDLLGAPMEDHAELQLWADALIATDALTREQVLAYLGRAVEYMTSLVAERRKDPKDDLISAFVAARDKDDLLSERELMALGLFVLIAGYVTTSSQIPKFIYALLTNPEQLAILRADLDLMPKAVDELMRYVPVGIGPLASRYAVEDVELNGVTVRAGQPVLLVPNSANRDESVYTNPDRLNLLRDEASHLAFGHGPHRCLGVPLATLELQIAVRTLLERLPGLRFADSQDVTWKTGLALRGLERMPLTWDQP